MRCAWSPRNSRAAKGTPPWKSDFSKAAGRISPAPSPCSPGAAIGNIVVILYFLTLGTHLQRDLPKLVEQARAAHPGVRIQVTPPLDGHPALLEARRRPRGAALVFCLMIAGLIVATFINFEHYIIPDEITLGGAVAGLLLAFFVPASHLSFPFLRPMDSPGAAMRDSFLGILVGAGVVYGVLRLGKLLFGRYRLDLSPGSRVLFTETTLKLPGKEMPYEEMFYRAGDTIRMEAERIEMIDRCYSKAEVRLQPHLLQVGQDTFEPDKVPHLEAVADEIVLPREAMGLGDVKFMAAIGAFLGWRAVLFSLAASSVIGSVVVGTLIALRRREWSTRLPYGPYIAVAAVVWIFGGYLWVRGLF